MGTKKSSPFKITPRVFLRFALALVFFMICLSISPILNFIKESRITPEDKLREAFENLDTAIELKNRLAQIPRKRLTLVEEPLLFLVPNGLNGSKFFVQGGQYDPADLSINPAAADFIFARESVPLHSLLAPPDPPWKIERWVRMDDLPNIFLLTRAAPVEQQLAPEDEIESRLEATTLIRDDINLTDSFRMDKFEVCHARFVKFLNDRRFDLKEVERYYGLHDPSSRIVFVGGQYRVLRGAQNLPIFNVSYYGAKRFCEYVGGRLPSIAQWQRASGQSDGRLFPWGSETNFIQRANLQGDEDGFAFWAPVDSFESGQSPSGVYNMAGNVYEWVEGLWLLGGSWAQDSSDAMTSHIDTNDPATKSLHDGFRCVYNFSR